MGAPDKGGGEEAFLPRPTGCWFFTIDLSAKFIFQNLKITVDLFFVSRKATVLKQKWYYRCNET